MNIHLQEADHYQVDRQSYLDIDGRCFCKLQGTVSELDLPHSSSSHLLSLLPYAILRQVKASYHLKWLNKFILAWDFMAPEKILAMISVFRRRADCLQLLYMKNRSAEMRWTKRKGMQNHFCLQWREKTGVRRSKVFVSTNDNEIIIVMQLFGYILT